MPRVPVEALPGGFLDLKQGTSQFFLSSLGGFLDLASQAGHLSVADMAWLLKSLLIGKQCCCLD